MIYGYEYKDGELTEDQRKIKILELVITEVMYMARRYAHGRSSYAPASFNRALDICLRLGIKIEDDKGGELPERYAEDGMFGKWVTETMTWEGVKK